jgi:hypothetical protein
LTIFQGISSDALKMLFDHWIERCQWAASRKMYLITNKWFRSNSEMAAPGSRIRSISSFQNESHRNFRSFHL